MSRWSRAVVWLLSIAAALPACGAGVGLDPRMEAILRAINERTSALLDKGGGGAAVNVNAEIVKLFTELHTLRKTTETKRDMDPEKFYDIITNQENRLVTELNSSGWKVFVNETARRMHSNRKCIYVGFIGRYDNGKTHILSKLTGRLFPMGHGVQTKGISGIFPRDADDSICYFDSAGVKRSIEYAKLRERIVTDRFVEDLILELCDVIVFVSDEFNIDMQEKINQLEARVYDEYKDSDPKKQLIVVHNYKAFTTIPGLNQQIEWDVKEAFKAERKLYGQNMPDHVYFYRQRGQDRIRHVIYAAEDSEAGNQWNNHTLALLRNFFNSAPADKTADPLGSVLRVLPQVLRDYVQPFARPMDERDGSFAQNLQKILSFPRRVIKYLVDSTAKYVTVIGAPPEWPADDNPYEIQYKNGTIRMKTPRPLHFWPTPGSGQQFSPPSTIFENDDHWIVHVDLPGVYSLSKLADGTGVTCSLEPTSKLLVIRGVRSPSPEMVDINKSTENYTYDYEHRVGRNRFEPFVLHFQLPNEVDAKSPSKKLENGVLKITFLKLRGLVEL